MTVSLPPPAKERFRPSRAGIVNLWHYDIQVFNFAHGRMVLRGGNGSGKTTALSALWPLLVDGRLTPFVLGAGNPRSFKAMLLASERSDDGRWTYGKDSGHGYVWMEFERIGADGTASYVTCGIGGRATKSSDVDSWQFVTTKRVGIDIELFDDERRPLSRGQLRELLGLSFPPPVGTSMSTTADSHASVPRSSRRGRERIVSSCVFDRAEDYRDAVADVLFGTSGDWVRRVVDQLLITLRRPKLTEKLDTEKLSSILSDALAPIDAALVDDVAGGFEALDRIRQQVEVLETTVRQLHTLEPRVSKVARMALVDASRTASAAESEHRARNRSLTRANTELEQAESRDRELAHRFNEVRSNRQAADGELAGLRESSAYKDAHQVAQLEETRGVRQLNVERAEERRDQSVADRDILAADTKSASDASVDAASKVGLHRVELSAALDEMGAAIEVNADADAGVRPVIDAALSDRRAQIGEVRVKLSARDKAEVAAGAARRALTETEELLTRAVAAQAVAQENFDQARTDVADAGVRFVADARSGGLVHVVSDAVDHLADVAAELEADSGPWRAALDELVSADREAFAEVRRSSAALADELDRTIAATRAERDRVAAETEPTPTAAPWRTVDLALPGAPLWSCVDPLVNGPELAAVESVLAASGLLDAWVSPDGNLEVNGELVAGHAVVAGGPRTGQTLARFLAPVEGAELDASTVMGALEAVSVVAAGDPLDSDACVALDGRFRTGSLCGVAPLRPAAHLGAPAREAERQRRLGELDTFIEDLTSRQATAISERDVAAGKLEFIARLVNDAASIGSVLDAHRRLLGAATTVESRAGDVESRRNDHVRSAAALEKAVAELEETAGRYRLPRNLEHLEAVAESVATAERCLRAFVEASTRATSLAERHGELDKRYRRLCDEVVQAERGVVSTSEELAKITARIEALRSSIGAEPEAILTQVSILEQRLVDLGVEEAEVRDAQLDARSAVGTTSQAVSDAQARVAEADTARQGALERFTMVLSDPTASSLAGDGDGATFQRAREIADAHRDLDVRPELRQRETQLLAQEANDVKYNLAAGMDLSIDITAVVPSVRVIGQDGAPTPLLIALERLEATAAEERARLTSRERELFTEHFLGRLAGELRSRLAEADERVAGINRSLASAPTTSGMTVSLRWDVDADVDETAVAAVRLLRRDPDDLTDAERDELRRFFLGGIEQRRAEAPQATYAEVLGDLLDYRSWHHFVLRVREGRTGRSFTANANQFPTLSGGEQSVVLHQPLFAALDATFATAHEHAPRLFALDEAFVAVDETSRANLLGLLVRFDLDVLIVSHEFWGTFPEIPAIQIYTLRHDENFQAVLAQPALWHGNKLVAGAEAVVGGEVPSETSG
jgi:uncharacterized protein (TIGR02680 family)